MIADPFMSLCPLMSARFSLGGHWLFKLQAWVIGSIGCNISEALVHFPAISSLFIEKLPSAWILTTGPLHL